MKFSKPQQAIFAAVSSGKSNLLIDALAGTGKTTTLLECTKRVGGKKGILSFNKSIAVEIQAKVKGQSDVEVKTIHSHGYRAIANALGGGRFKVDGRKYTYFIKEELEKALEGRGQFAALFDKTTTVKSEVYGLAAAMAKLCSLLQNACAPSDVKPGDVRQFILDHDINLDPEQEALYLAMHPWVYKKSIDILKKKKVMSFDDMIWAPFYLNATFPKFDWLFVDECQDLSSLKANVVMRSISKKGRIVWVGDKNQAIYAFAGANAESFVALSKLPNTKQLPLHICYRCPSTILDEARKIVPQIQGVSATGEGEVIVTEDDIVNKEAKPEDLVICRFNRPLINKCYELIGQRIPAYVEGRDLHTRMKKNLEEAFGLYKKKYLIPTKPDKVLEAINLFYAKEYAKLEARDATEGPAMNRLDDNVGALRFIATCEEFSDVRDIFTLIDELFREKRNAIKLCTIHKSKGLEARRVFILGSGELGKSRKKAERHCQEANLRYVAITRAQETLYMC